MNTSGFFNPAYVPIDGVIEQGINWSMLNPTNDILIDTIYGGYFNNSLSAAGLNATNVIGRILICKGQLADVTQLLKTYNQITNQFFPGIIPVLDLPINDFGARRYHFPEPVHFRKGETATILVFAGYRQLDVYGTPTQTIGFLTVSGRTIENWEPDYARAASPKGEWR